jgi:hypothetical protein
MGVEVDDNGPPICIIFSQNIENVFTSASEGVLTSPNGASNLKEQAGVLVPTGAG